MEYKGFALELEAPSLLSVAPIESLTGKFQISGGLGPADVLAIVSAPSIQEPENGNLESDSADSHSSVDGEPMGANLVKNGEESLLKDPVAVENNVAQIPRPRISSQKLLCLIGKDQPVRPGQTATVVLSGKAKTDVLAAPVNAVAGRVGKGSVTLFKDGAPSIIEVGLGISDGAYIEITSGLSEGDVISNAAPYLDPRKK